MLSRLFVSEKLFQVSSSVCESALRTIQCNKNVHELSCSNGGGGGGGGGGGNLTAVDNIW